MYKCRWCGEVFGEEDMATSVTSHFCGNSSSDEEFGECPNCGEGMIEEAVQCKECGEWFFRDELHEGYCDDCLKNNATFDNVLRCAEENDDAKGFAESILTEEEITNILINAAREKVKLIGRICDGVEKYALDDKDSFGYFLANRG